MITSRAASERAGTRRQRHSPPALTSHIAAAALLFVFVAALALVAAAIVRRDLNPIENSLSYYAVGPWWFFQSTAFVATGAAAITLGIGLLLYGSSLGWLALSATMLIVSGTASIGLAVFPMGASGPSTPMGDTHQTAGTIAGVSQLVAALAFAIAVRSDPRWYRLAVTAKIVFFLALTGAMITQLAIWAPELEIPIGAAMRLVVVPLVALWGAVAMRLRTASRPTRSSAVT